MTVTSGYQDAYNTIGWTSQDANLPNATPGSPSMFTLQLPAGLIGLPVTGSWYDQYGPAWGNLLFTPSVKSVVVNDVECELSAYRVYLDNGALPTGFSVPVPDVGATTDPASWEWTVTGRVSNRNVEYSIPVPSSPNPFDLVADSGTGGVVDALPLVRNFTVAQGATFLQGYNWDTGNVNGLTGYTAHMQIRNHLGGAVVVDLTETSGITLTSTGDITVEVTAAQTSAMAAGTYVYDLFLTAPNGGATTQFLSGTFQVTSAVTT